MGIAENVSMTANHFVNDLLPDIGKGDFPLFFCNHHLKQYIHQHIAQFLTDIGNIIAVDGIDQFGTFAVKTLDQALPGLLPIPRATIRCTQPAQNRHQRIGIGRIFRHQKENPTLKCTRNFSLRSRCPRTTG